MIIEEQKKAAAAAAIEWLDSRLHADAVIGIGTGSTADHFIDLLAPHRTRFAGAVASSTRSADRLGRQGIRVFDLNDVVELPIYVDGADEITAALEMIKGGGGALTREKIVASASQTFVCIADASKRVETLGAFPLAVEVIPMARAHVARKLEALGRELGLEGKGWRATIRLRTGADGTTYMTDNGNCILDVVGWTIADARATEARIGAIVGVVESGLFALRGADLLFLAGPDGVEQHGAARG
jgi:ribose 5-phosphate isomerase A